MRVVLLFVVFVMLSLVPPVGAQSTFSADLALTYREPGVIPPGAEVPFRVNVWNQGPDAAQSPILVAVLPINTTFAFMQSPGDWRCDAINVPSYTRVVCAPLGKAMLPGMQTFIFRTKTANDAQPGETLLAQFSIISGTVDPNMSNNVVAVTALVR